MKNSSPLQDGIYAAALTPLNEDLSCNQKKLAAHCFDLVARGCAGIALFGTTGEGSSFSTPERIETLRQLIQSGFNPKKIILANGSSSISDTVELGHEAAKQECAAFLIAPPSFYKNISDSGLLTYFREIIQRIDHPNLPILLYHIPQFTGVPITLELIRALTREFPSIVIGMKESEGNLPLTKQILHQFPQFKLFVAKEKQIIEAVHLGSSGAICGIANLYPELIHSLYTQGKKALVPNPAAIDQIFQALKDLPFIPAAKALMESREGAPWHRLRPPLAPLTSVERYKLADSHGA